jgi:hypothetical protein
MDRSEDMVVKMKKIVTNSVTPWSICL